MLYRSANEVRSQLDRAAKAKAVLEAAVRALAKSGRSEDVQAVEDAAAAAGPLADLLVEDLKAARESLAHIHALAASEAKLARALKEGSTSAALARAVQVRALFPFGDLSSLHLLAPSPDPASNNTDLSWWRSTPGLHR